MVLAPRLRIWLLIAFIAAAAAALWVVMPQPRGVATFDLRAWLLVVIGCTIGEAYVVHFNSGRHVHTLAFADVPLVIGLFLVSPETLLTARLAGSLIALGLLRRQPALKLAFNLAQFALGISAALVMWGAAGSRDLRSPLAWVVAVVALIIVGLISFAAVSAVIWLDGGRPTLQHAARTVATSLLTAAAQTSFALIALSVEHVNASGLWAVAVVAGFLGLAQRSHVRLQKRHGALQQLNDVASRLNRDLHTQTIAQEIVVGAARTLDGETAELEIAGPDGNTLVVRYDGATVTISKPLATTTLDARAAGREVDRVTAPVHLNGAPAGRLTVSSSTSVRVFGDDEQQVLAALAQHAGTALTNGRLADELRLQAAENEHQATHDALTGLPNRLMFERVLSALLAHDREVAVLLFDLDRFKEVNDTLGHAAGDALLTDVGARLKAAVPDALCIARLGGDEFTMLLTGPDVAAAHDAANRARDALLHPVQLNSVDVSIDASIGIALAPGHGTTTDELLRHADVAMYDAKDSRGAVSVYDPSIDHNDASRLALVGELREAIATGALHLNYQPKVALTAGHDTASVEALCRWQHPTRGFVSPEEFIAVAEQTGLITPLTDWVITTALAQCRAWLDAGLDMSMSVNISARVLRDDLFPDRLVAALEAANVPAARLTLEITETAIMSDVGHAIDVLWRLRRAGVRLSVDDLGVGHSSLAYLKKLPVDEVKIDKSFVLTMGDDQDDDAIVCAVVGLAHRLRMTAVAEGVETARVRDRLVDIGCDVAQGYWYSRPMPAADVAAWFAGRADHGARPALRPVPGVA